jgi:hypothetical protein
MDIIDAEERGGGLELLAAWQNITYTDWWPSLSNHADHGMQRYDMQGPCI